MPMPLRRPSVPFWGLVAPARALVIIVDPAAKSRTVAPAIQAFGLTDESAPLFQEDRNPFAGGAGAPVRDVPLNDVPGPGSYCLDLSSKCQDWIGWNGGGNPQGACMHRAVHIYVDPLPN